VMTKSAMLRVAVGVLCLLPAGGCVAIGLGSGTGASKSDLVGSWQSTCDEKVVLKKGGTGSVSGMHDDSASSPTTGPILVGPASVSWELFSPTLLSITTDHLGWQMLIGRKNGKVIFSYRPNRDTCVFSRA
jgi:hypothetical protein